MEDLKAVTIGLITILLIFHTGCLTDSNPNTDSLSPEQLEMSRKISSELAAQFDWFYNRTPQNESPFKDVPPSTPKPVPEEIAEQVSPYNHLSKMTSYPQGPGPNLYYRSTEILDILQVGDTINYLGESNSRCGSLDKPGLHPCTPPPFDRRVKVQSFSYDWSAWVAKGYVTEITNYSVRIQSTEEIPFNYILSISNESFPLAEYVDVLNVNGSFNDGAKVDIFGVKGVLYGRIEDGKILSPTLTIGYGDLLLFYQQKDIEELGHVELISYPKKDQAFLKINGEDSGCIFPSRQPFGFYVSNLENQEFCKLNQLE
jgi:hypothetical protein